MLTQDTSLHAKRRLPLPSGLSVAALAASTALACAAALPAQISVRRLIDVEDTPVGNSSNPEFGAELPDGSCVFAATDATHGREIWRTANGSAPVLLKDILPGSLGSVPSDFVLFQGEVWFSASDGQNGRELWKTDGTANGTVLVVDLIAGGGGSAPSGLVVQGNRLYFSAFDAAGGREPHASTGTAAGTALLKDIRPGGAGSEVGFDATHTFVPSDVGNDVFFSADDGTSGVELWKTDGTTAGTVLVLDLNPGPDDGYDPNEPAVVRNGTLFFRGEESTTTGSELFRSDGTAAGTRIVRDLRAGSSDGFPSDLIVHQGKVFFSAVDTNLGRELFESDGTFVGTRVVRDLAPGSSSSSPRDLVSCGNLIYFSASDPQSFIEPHISDGTSQGTQMLADLNPGAAGSLPERFTCCGNLVFFAARGANEGEELYVTDGRLGNVTLLADFLPGTDSGSPEDFFCCSNGRLVGSVATTDGREMFESDGTVSGTRALDLDPGRSTAGSSPRQFRGVDHRTFYFVATTALHGSEVFFFDGAVGRAIEVNFGPTSSAPGSLTVVGRTAYWTSSTPTTGTELFRSTDGGPAELVADIRPGTLSSSPRDLIALDHETLVATARTANQGTELIVARNGQSGVQVFDIDPGARSSFPDDLTKLIDGVTGGNFIVFSARSGAVGDELFAFDGVDVQLAVDFEPGTSSSSPRKFSVNPDGTALLLEAFFNGSNRLMRVTVNENPTGFTGGFIIEQLVEIARSFNFNNIQEPSEELRALGFAAFVEADDPGVGVTGEELYFIDGNGNPRVIFDIHAGLSGSDPEILALTSSGIVAAATDETGEREIVQFNAKTGTIRFVDAFEGPESSEALRIADHGDAALLGISFENSSEKVIFTVDGDGNLNAGPPVGQRIRDAVALGPVVVAGAVDVQAGGGEEPVAISAPSGRAVKFGSSCNGRAKTFATVPHVGADVTWKTIGGELGDFGFQFIGAPAPTTTKIVGCDSYVDPSGIVLATTGPAPQFSTTITLPADPSLVSVEFVVQGGWVSPSSGDVNLSDAVYQSVGN